MYAQLFGTVVLEHSHILVTAAKLLVNRVPTSPPTRFSAGPAGPPVIQEDPGPVLPTLPCTAYRAQSCLYGPVLPIGPCTAYMALYCLHGPALPIGPYNAYGARMLMGS